MVCLPAGNALLGQSAKARGAGAGDRPASPAEKGVGRVEATAIGMGFPGNVLGRRQFDGGLGGAACSEQ